MKKRGFIILWCAALLSASAFAETTMPAVAGGGWSSLILRADGTVMGQGGNYSGDLGQGDIYNRRTSPTLIEGFSDISRIAMGSQHSVATKHDGTLWAWGGNFSGQLGLGDEDDRLTPVQVPGVSGVTQVAAASGFTLALGQDGSVWASGGNWAGALGLGDTEDRTTFTKLSGVSDVTTIGTGTSHSLAIKSDGSVWAWGYNWNGQLGLGDTTQREVPTKVDSIEDVVAIAGGSYHTLAAKRDGTVYAWGANGFGQLGNGGFANRLVPVLVDGLTDVVAVAASSYSSYALTRQGNVYAWGYNFFGQLGLGHTTNQTRPQLIGSLSDVIAISAGQAAAYAIKADGSVWSFGWNAEGQLGLGNTTDRWTPTQISAAEHVASTLTPARVDFGTIERGADVTPQSVAFQVTTGSMNLNFAKDALGVDAGAPGLFSGYTPGTCTSGLMSDASGSCQFDLTGKINGGTGPRVGRLAIPADGTLAKAVVLTATANITGSWLKADRSVVDFGKRALNTPVDETVIFTNRGTADVSVSNVQTTGTGFSVTEENCTAAGVLNPGATCTVSVRYAATRGGAFNGRLVLTTDAVVPVIRLSLTGLGDAPRLVRSQARFAFGTVPKGTTSDPQTLTLRNAGTKALSLTSFNLMRPGPFGIVGNTCGATLDPGADCSVMLQYAPNTRKAHQNRAILVTDDPSNPTLDFPLTGTGG
ncbi:RCC1 domain-containing protein [Methylolobus aquaticus]